MATIPKIPTNIICSILSCGKLKPKVNQVLASDRIVAATERLTEYSNRLEELIERYPAMQSELFDAKGALHTGIHVFLNGRDVRYLDGLDMEIPADAEVRIFPPVGGGCEVTSWR